MLIADLQAIPLTCRIPPEHQVSLGIGKTVKRDAVLVRLVTSDGLVGWGEAHAARAPTVIAELVNSTLRPLVLGMPVRDTDAVWERVYRAQLASHGTGAAAAIALSGIDLALWDAIGKADGRPLCALLGAAPRPLASYAGGISLGYQPLPALVDEAQRYVRAGFRAVKLRLGEHPTLDIARVQAVRQALGPAVDILVDANCAYTVESVRAVMPALDAARVGWLEEPFPAHDVRSYRAIRGLGVTPIAAGENHYTRFDFERLLEEGVVTVWQPDLSKTGGVTEALRIARLAASAGLAIHPHTSVTGLNVAATLHFLAAIPNAGYFEADCAACNPLRTELTTPVAAVTPEGTFLPPAGAGLGTAVDERALAAFPVVAGAGYVRD